MFTPTLDAQTSLRSRATNAVRDTLVIRDTMPLSLSDVLSLALRNSEEVRLAKSQVDLAKTQITIARSQALPQINGNLQYLRTLASPFQSSGITIPDSLKFQPDSLASVANRLSYLEKNTPNAALGSLGSLFGDLPFGQENTYTGTLSASQLLYSGGRVGTALKIAARFKEAADFTYQEEVAKVELDVRSAYYRASLAQELEIIAAAALEQAQKFLDQEQLRFKAGASSELDVLRAEVSLENLRPQLIDARNAREIATLDLKRIVNISMSQPLKLTTTLTAPTDTSEIFGSATEMEAELNRRAVLQAAERQVAIKGQQISLARGAYLPSLSLDFRYGGVLYPTKPFDFSGTDIRRDASATVTMQIPIFSGFRRQAELQQAKVEKQQSELQLSQLREGVQLEYERARGERSRALSSIAARQRTVDQAARVYDLTVLRYDKGLATQLETSDARLALLQARTNLVQALADYYIADAQVNKSLGRSITQLGA